MEIITSQKGRDCCLHEGYRYRRDRKNADGSESWRCCNDDTTCKGRIKCTADGNINMTTVHNHAPDESKNEVEKAKASIRQRAENTVEKPRHIILQCSNGMSTEAATMMPAYRASQRTIQRKRKRNEEPIVIPTSLRAIALTENLTVTSRNEAFLLFDSGADDDRRILMFGTMKNLQSLEEHSNWFIDGTFKVSPDLFVQVFTIHALIDNSAVPLVYALLPSKEQADYVRVFGKLFELRNTLAPQSILCDFEKASQNAAAQIFSGCRIVGCLFHLGQSLWRKIQECGLVTSYRDGENIRMYTKMLLALAFIPIIDVPDAFDELNENRPDELDAVYDYWEDTYVDRKRRNLRAPPRFCVECWNVRDRVENGLPRTNNSVEGWHHAFQHTVDCNHPNLYKLVEHFKQEQDHVEQQIERYNAGVRQAEASKTKYVQLNRRLCALIPTYGQKPLLDFLRAVSYNLTL
jgi:hypothetical protein